MNHIGIFPPARTQGPVRLGAPGGWSAPNSTTFGIANLQTQLSFFSQSLTTSQNLFQGWGSFGGGGGYNSGYQTPFYNPGINSSHFNPGFNMNFMNPGFNNSFLHPGFANLIGSPGINSPFPAHPGFNGGGFTNPGFGGGFGGHPGISHNALPAHLLSQGMPPIPMF